MADRLKFCRKLLWINHGFKYINKINSSLMFQCPFPRFMNKWLQSITKWKLTGISGLLVFWSKTMLRQSHRLTRIFRQLLTISTSLCSLLFFCNLNIEEVLPDVHIEPPVFQFLSCTSTEYHWKDPASDFFAVSFQSPFRYF